MPSCGVCMAVLVRVLVGLCGGLSCEHSLLRELIIRSVWGMGGTVSYLSGPLILCCSCYRALYRSICTKSAMHIMWKLWMDFFVPNYL
jgi:hypothetical protein